MRNIANCCNVNYSWKQQHEEEKTKKSFKFQLICPLSKLEYILRAMIGFGRGADTGPTNKYASQDHQSNTPLQKINPTTIPHICHIFRHARVSSTYPCLSVGPLVTLSDFQSVSVSGRPTWKIEERGPQLFFNFGSGCF